MERINIYLAGDSTMSNYEMTRAPRTGWGQVLRSYFTDDVKIWNEAASGRSSKTFMEEGRLEKINNRIGTNDYLFIQFGHNDAKLESERYTEPFTTYKEYLTKYIDVARGEGAFPLLLTPIQRRNFTPDGKIIDSHGDYAVAMRELASELDVPLLDLTVKSNHLLEELGDEPSKQLFMWLAPDEFEYYPNGEQDNTHFSIQGAHKVAGLFIDGLKEIGHPLVKYIVG